MTDSNTVKSNWKCLGNATSITDDDGTLINSTNSVGNFLTNTQFAGDIAFEFEVVTSYNVLEAYISHTGAGLNKGYRTDSLIGSYYYFYGIDEARLNRYNSHTLTDGDIVKLTRVGKEFKFYVNEELKGTCTTNIGTSGSVGFFVYHLENKDDRKIKIKNVKVYNI